MALKEAISEGQKMFLIGHIKDLFNIFSGVVEDGKMMAVRPVPDMVGADNALFRLLKRCPEYAVLDAGALAGRKVSRIIWQTVMEHRLASSLSIWLPAMWTFEALLCRLFLEEVRQGTILLAPDEEDVCTIAEVAKERLPQDFIEAVLLKRDSELAHPVFLRPDPDEFPRNGPHGVTIH